MVKLLLDSCVWGGARLQIEQAGHDVIWAGAWQHDPGDDEILAQAYREARILVTLDKDFGELAIVRRLPHAGIIRLVDVSALQQAAACLSAVEKYGAELQAGAIVTVEPDRTRIRPSDQQE
jgi:predicted nuclease of predicted toxin-antitoxin system